MIELRVSGANELAAITAKMKAAGDRGMHRELLADVRKAAKPLVAEAKAAARENLPKGGGLNEVVAASKFGVRTRTSGRNPGVRVVGVSGHSIARMDQGVIRHPDYPRGPRSTWKWSTQRIPPGWFTKAMEGKAPEVRQELVRALDGYARRLSA